MFEDRDSITNYSLRKTESKLATYSQTTHKLSKKNSF